MSLAQFKKNSDIYSCCKELNIIRHDVFHSLFKKFCFELKRFNTNLNEDEFNEFWRPFLSFFKRYRFKMCASPLPLNYSLNHDEDKMYKRMMENLNICKEIYPQHYDRAQNLHNNYIELTKQELNPILDIILDITSLYEVNSENVAIVIKEYYLVPEIENLINQINSMKNINILVPNQLISSSIFEAIIVIGSPNWYHDYLFASPRSKNIHIVAYNWISGSWKIEPLLINSHLELPSSHKDLNERLKSSEVEIVEDIINAEEIIPMNLDSLASVIRRNDSETRDIEDVDARLYQIEGGYVFLDSSTEAKSLIVDMDNYFQDEKEESSVLKRISNSDIKPGMFILVRTRSGGDYIQSIADKFLGQNAYKYRAEQSQWKNRLREYVRNKGLLETSLDLLDLGSNIANETNLRRWMSMASIKTHKYEDFYSIMRLIGLVDQASDYWDHSVVIDSAHRKAGFHIRDLLLNQLMNSNLDQLHKTGILELQLQENDAGSISVIRVLGLHQDIFTVKESKLGTIFDEDSIWQ